MTKRDLIKEIFAELSAKRNHAKVIAEHNKRIAEQNNEFREILKNERYLKLELGKLQFEQQDTTKLKEKLNELESSKVVALQKIGLSISDLQPKYDCKKCLDTGVFENSICSCVSQMYNNKLMLQCNVNLNNIPMLNDYDYKFFTDEGEQTFAKKCVKTLTDYVNKFDNLTLKNIVMCGASGTGKTYLTQCIAKELIAKNKTTLFISSFDLNSLFMEQHLSNFGEKDNLKNLIDVDALIIDDLGTEPVRKNVTKEYLLILLNERLAKNKSTIITTNLNPDNVLDKYEERIFSRIFNKRSTLILQFDGKNNRLKK